MTNALHHLEIRKRIYQKHEKYPHPNKLKRLVDNLIYFIGIVGPLLALPQAFTIWTTRNAANVSLLSWSGFLVISVFWTIYGVIHKEKPIIVSSSLYTIINAIVVLGILVYG